jgi:hypothetical protein
MIAIIFVLTIILLLLYAIFNNNTLEEPFIPAINSRIRPVIRNTRLNINNFTDNTNTKLSVMGKKLGLI